MNSHRSFFPTSQVFLVSNSTSLLSFVFISWVFDLFDLTKIADCHLGFVMLQTA